MPVTSGYVLLNSGDKFLSKRERTSWRRGRDSTPRYGCPYAAFRVRCIQPLCHLSGAENSLKRPHADGRYLTKRAQRDKRQARVARRILSDLEREPAADRQNDAPPPEIRPHP